jgi:superoxide reductase
MNRRNFLMGAVLTTAALTSRKTLAGEYEHKTTKDINKLSNRENPSVMEQKHVPALEIPDNVQPGTWFDVKVRVGFAKEHPSTLEHWITMIQLLIDGKEIAKTQFKRGGVSAPAAAFRVKLDKPSVVEAIEHCNLHGTWGSDPVTVKII